MAATTVKTGAKPDSFIDAKKQGEGDEWGGSLSACVLPGTALCMGTLCGKSQRKSAANKLLQVNSP
jgi:hypothetical protein